MHISLKNLALFGLALPSFALLSVAACDAQDESPSTLPPPVVTVDGGRPDAPDAGDAGADASNDAPIVVPPPAVPVLPALVFHKRSLPPITIGQGYTAAAGLGAQCARVTDVKPLPNGEGSLTSKTLWAPDDLPRMLPWSTWDVHAPNLANDPELRSFAAEAISSASTSETTLNAFTATSSVFQGDLQELPMTTTCGESYVAQVNTGAAFLYGARLDFVDADAERAFRTAYRTATNPYLVATTDDPDGVGWALYQKATIRIVAVQLGGDASTLEAVANANDCSTSSLRGCAKTLRALGAYQANPFGKDLGTPPQSMSDLGGWGVVEAILMNAIRPAPSASAR